MNGIDISNYQNGINLTTVPCDFVICKATEGNYYISPDFKRQMNQGLEAGKLMGIYHYANGGDAITEAKFFLKTIKPYIGKAILCLDWESTNNKSYNKNDADWCMKFLDYIKQETGVTGFLYISASLMSRMNSVLKKYHSWIAQYASYDRVNGYQSKPWNEGSYKCDIRQYTSQMWLSGYFSHLDADKAYITAEQWKAYQQAETKQESPASAPTSASASTPFNLPMLNKGMVGMNVKVLQTLLVLHGFRMSAGVDGDFGTQTYNAVVKFQTSKGLDADGIVGINTWKALLCC